MMPRSAREAGRDSIGLMHACDGAIKSSSPESLIPAENAIFLFNTPHHPHFPTAPLTRAHDWSLALTTDPAALTSTNFGQS